MGAFDGIQGMVAAYLISPKGQETMRNFLSSPQGKDAIDVYLSTPAGQDMARLLLLRALDNLDIAETVKDQIRVALAEKGTCGP
ncbi:MAG: hypothetical protein PHD55_09270 [Methanoregula sp.]|nr:hypothetical protein [Methanoregula sp.]